MAYENIINWTLGENKPNSNPIKANLINDKTNATLFATKDYRKNDDFVVRINKPNLVRRRRMPKMNVNAFLQKDYENEPPSGPKKQTQNKPNFERPKSLAGKSGHTLLWIYLNLFLTPPGQTVRVPPSNLNLLYYHL